MAARDRWISQNDIPATPAKADALVSHWEDPAPLFSINRIEDSNLGPTRHSPSAS